MPDSDKKDYFHFAKLALFNVHLLNDIEQARGTKLFVAALVSQRCNQDAIIEPVSLMHQATFLQFAYISLVWLWEKAKKGNNKGRQKIMEYLSQRFDFKKVAETKKGPRNLDEPKEVVRLIRNAISHGHVVVDKNFIFRDKSSKESDFTSISLAWRELGQLSEHMIFAWNKVLYPEDSESQGLN